MKKNVMVMAGVIATIVIVVLTAVCVAANRSMVGAYLPFRTEAYSNIESSIECCLTCVGVGCYIAYVWEVVARKYMN